MRQNTRLAILAAELERQSPPETSHQAPVARQLEPEPEEETSDGDRQPLHSATASSLRGGAPSKRETVKREGAPKGEAGIESPDPRTPILRTPRMARSGSESVQATPSTVPRSAPEGKRECAVCSLQKSPRWRTGPDGPKTLCNRCGVYWATMRHKWDNLVARFKGDSHTKTRGTPATIGGEEEEEGATGVSVPRGRKPGKGKVTDPTPTPKNTRKRTTRTIPNPTPLAQGNGGPPFLDSATANGLNGGIATRSAEHAPAAARQLELATEEKSKPPKKRWIEELTDTSPKRRSGQAVRWRALSDEGDVAAAEPSNGGPAKRRRTEIEALRSSMASESEEGLPLPDVRKEGRMQRGLARVLEAQREANGGPEVAEPSPREKEAAPAKRRRTELDGLLDLVKKEEVPRTGDGRLQRGLARVLEAQRLANGDGEEMDVALGPLESGELMTRRRLGRRANGSLGEEESSGLGEDHNPALVRNRKSKPPNGLGKGLGGRRELRPRSGNRSRGGDTESESEGEQGKLGRKGKWEEGGLANGLKDEWRKVPEKRGRGEVLSDALGGVPNEENGISEHGPKDRTALCMVCEVRPREALFSPCGHFNFCYSCAMQHHKGKGDCPKCGQRVTGVQKVVL